MYRLTRQLSQPENAATGFCVEAFTAIKTLLNALRLKYEPMTIATQVCGHANARCIQESLPAVLQAKVHWPVPAAGDAGEQMGLCQVLPSAEQGCWTAI